MAVSYSEIRNKIKTGDLLEWRSKSILGFLIRSVTKKNVNHTSLCVALDEYLYWKEPHKFILEAVADGIDLNLISEELKTFKGKVFWYPLKSQYDNKRDAIAKWALLQIGKKYDYKSLFKNIIGKVSVDAKKYFCSEFCFDVLRQPHIQILSGQIAPRPGEFGQYSVFADPVEIDLFK